MQTFGIGELSRQTGVPDSTIHYYERIGLLPLPARQSGKRRYDSSAIEQLQLIRMAQRAGFSIADTGRLLHDFPAGTPASARWRAFSAAKLAEVSAAIAQLEQTRAMLRQTLDCVCTTFDQCVTAIGK